MEIVKRGTYRYINHDKDARNVCPWLARMDVEPKPVPGVYADYTYAARSPTQHHTPTNSSTQQGLYSVNCGTITNTSAVAVNPVSFTFAG